MKTKATILLSIVLLLPLAATAQPPNDLTAESQELAEKIEQYFNARERENDALAEFSRLSRLLDETLGDPHSGRSELINLDTQVKVARERACAYTEETAERRRSMFESMKRVAAMVQELERLGLATDGSTVDVGGWWQVEAQPSDVWGFLELAQDGMLVTGSYRLSNGSEGSMKGTFSGGHLKLEMVDSERGTVGDVEGEIDAESGEIHGTWSTREVGSGRPAAGEWTARRVSMG